MLWCVQCLYLLSCQDLGSHQQLLSVHGMVPQHCCHRGCDMCDDIDSSMEAQAPGQPKAHGMLWHVHSIPTADFPLWQPPRTAANSCVSFCTSFALGSSDRIPWQAVPVFWHRTTVSGVQDSPKQDMGASGSVSSLIGPRFLIFGDAAHSVKPDLGQGCNSGLQDGHIFSQVGSFACISDGC